jgi:hypothetical protein
VLNLRPFRPNASSSWDVCTAAATTPEAARAMVASLGEAGRWSGRKEAAAIGVGVE